MEAALMKQKFSRVLAFLLAIALGIAILPVCTANTVYADDGFSGSGTEDDPYLISTADDLVALQEAVNSGTSYSGCYFQLTADITLPTDWTVIGISLSCRFYGTFDGAGHTITFPEGYTTADSVVGLFGYAGTNSDRVTIKDLTVDGEITATDAELVGAVVVYAAGYIENCVSNVDMDIALYNNTNGSSSYDILLAGGIAACFFGGSMAGCINNGDITYTITSTVSLAYPNTTYYGWIRLGGLVGSITYTSANPSEIINCLNTGDIDVTYCNVPTTIVSTNAGLYFGCLVGYAGGSGSVVTCANTGSFSLPSGLTSDINFGSIDGRNSEASTVACYTSFDAKAYYSNSTEGDKVTYVESFDLEAVWGLNTQNGEEENSMFWTLDSEDQPTAATDDSPAVVRVLYQFDDGTEEAVYTKAGSTASLPEGYSDVSFVDFIPDVTIVTEDITVVEGEGETEHQYEAVVTEPTCDEQGYTTYTCTICRDSYIDDYTDALGHSWTSVTVSAGSYGSTKTTYTCSVCGKEKTVTSLYGSSRYETAADIVSNAFENSTYAVIADGSNFPDALAAASLAGALDAPILITSDSRIQDTIEELKSLGVTYVYIVGGTSSVSAGAISAIEAESIEVKRIAGDTRQLTAVAVAEEVLSITGEQDVCLVATGKTYADALAASPYAYWSASPIYLTKNDGSISDEVLASIKAAGYSQIIILGGTSSVTEATEEALSEIASVTRLGGDTRYETAAIIAAWSVEQGMSYNGLTVATGTNYPDALTASALCGKNGSVLLLSAATAEASAVLEKVIDANAEDISDIYIVGGDSSVSEEIREMITDAIIE